MSEKNKHAQALGRLAKGHKKTITPAALASRLKGYNSGLKRFNEARTLAKEAKLSKPKS